jgi:hypothetical protein
MTKAAANKLAKRLYSEGRRVVMHRYPVNQLRCGLPFFDYVVRILTDE